jgi:catechol 2,3-dioxygenase-like lactoylglutathione lyase family enzyme
MKRIHIGLSVADIPGSVAFYTRLFGAEPTLVKEDYAKWQLEDPRVNFSLSRRSEAPGAYHLGIQVETAAELADISDRLRAAGEPLLDEGETTCCYHRSDKAWAVDPQRVRWETFLTHGETTVYGEDGFPAGPASEAEERPVKARCCT